MSLSFTALAAILHFATPLPKPYTWFEPLRTLRAVAQLEGFPAVVVIIYVLGLGAREGWRELISRVRTAAFPPLVDVARGALAVLLLFVFDAFVIEARRPLSDIVPLVILGAFASRYRPKRTELAREGAYIVVATAVFLAICYFFTVLKALTFMTGRSYDAAIVAIESSVFGVAPHKAIARWMSTHPTLLWWCDWVYFRFFHHMALTTVLLVAMRKPRERTEYLGALALCYVLAGPLYHVWPAAGPAFVEPQLFGYIKDPTLMVHEVRTWLADNTSQILDGSARELRTWGYIACMPSLHVAQEFVMLYYTRHSLPAFLLSLSFTSVTLLSVVALGWHYPIDSLSGVLLAAIAVRLARRWRDTLLPAAVMGPQDACPHTTPWFERLRSRQHADADRGQT